jgi:hypothetical protein
MYAWLVGYKVKDCGKQQCPCYKRPIVSRTVQDLKIRVKNFGYCYYDLVYTTSPDGSDIEFDHEIFLSASPFMRLSHFDI